MRRKTFITLVFVVTMIFTAIILCAEVTPDNEKEKNKVVSTVAKSFNDYHVEFIKDLGKGRYILKLSKGNYDMFVMTDGDYLYPSAFDLKDKNNIIDDIKTKYSAVELDPEKAGIIKVASSNKTNRKLIIVTDFECPYCKASFAELEKNIKMSFPEGLNIYYINFPLNFHKNADLLARIFILGKLKYDRNLAKELFGLTQDQLNRDYIIKRFAIELGIPEEQLEHEINSNIVNQRLTNDLDLVQKLHVNGTPTFFVNARDGSNKFYPIRNGNPKMIEIIKQGL